MPDNDPRGTAALAGLPVPLVLVDDRGDVRFANREAEKLLGYAVCDIIGRPIGRFLSTCPPEPRPYDRAALVVREYHPVLGPGRRALALDPGGRSVPVLVNAAPIVARGEALHVVVLRDISAFERDAAARGATDERVHRLLETARVIPWEADAVTTQFTYVGAQAEAILGYPIEAWYETDFWPRHIHPDDRDEALAICLSATQRRSHYSFEYRMIAADGRIVWLHDIVAVARVHDQPRLISGFMLDITDDKRAADERERLLVAARRALAARDEFLDIAAHELRTPLTPLRLHLDRAAGLSHSTAPREAVQRHVDVALRQCDRLEGLIDGMLEVARADARPPAVVRFDLAELVRDVVAGFATVAERSRCSLRVDVPGSVPGAWDRGAIEQALVNLLANAAKYGPGRPIEVALSADDTTARLVVRDHGVGIAPADQTRIFERFERAAPSSRYGGLGLGLYVARRVVRAHGGTITVDSEPDHGATFTVELPRDPPR